MLKYQIQNVRQLTQFFKKVNVIKNETTVERWETKVNQPNANVNFHWIVKQMNKMQYLGQLRKCGYELYIRSHYRNIVNLLRGVSDIKFMQKRVCFLRIFFLILAEVLRVNFDVCKLFSSVSDKKILSLQSKQSKIIGAWYMPCSFIFVVPSFQLLCRFETFQNKKRKTEKATRIHVILDQSWRHHCELTFSLRKIQMGTYRNIYRYVYRQRSIYTYVSLFPAIPENLKAMPSQEQWAHPDPDLVC